MATSRRSPRAASPVVVRRPDPAAWKQALALAGGDAKRLRLLDDGSIIVVNSAG